MSMGIMLVFAAFVIVLAIVWLSGASLCLGLENDQSAIYSAIKSETKIEFLKHHAKIDMTEDEIKTYLEGYMAMPIGWATGGDAWEKYHEQYLKYIRPSSINSSRT